MRFNGEIPALSPLAEVDFSAFDAFWEAALETAAGKVAMPWNWKFLEVMNDILQPHDLAIAELTEAESCDSTMLLCVGADAAALENLETCLTAFGLVLQRYEPMTGEAALEALRKRGETEELASRLVLAMPKRQADDDQEDEPEQFFSALAENFSTHILAERLAEHPALQDDNAGFMVDTLFVTLTSKPLGWLFRSIRTAFKGLLALLALGGAVWLGLRLGGHAGLAGDVFRFAAWGAGLLFLWCVTALCILGMAVRKHRRRRRESAP
jgi:hypothetical protein